MRNIKLNINERRDILTQHGSIPTQQYLFENHLSVDGKFLIFQDNIFDLKENKLIGNISDSIDNFIFLIENVKFPIGPESKIVNEIKKIFSSSIISESITDWGLLIEQAKTEKSWWDKTKDWASDKIDTANKILKEKGLGALIGASALYIARRIKEALWTAAGMIIDAFMVASGIGKSVQWIPWAIAFVLDVYQWSTGDYGDDTEFKEASTFWKILTLGFEALGMLSAGPVALAAKKLFTPVKAFKTEGQIAQWVSKNPAAKSTLEKITNLIGSVGGKLQGLAKSFEASFPTLAKWIKSSMNLVGGFLTKIGNFLKKIWSLLGAPGRGARKVGEKIQQVTKINPKYNIGAGLQSATNVGMVLGGVEGVKKYGEYKQDQQIDSIINQSASPSDYESLTF